MDSYAEYSADPAERHAAERSQLLRMIDVFTNASAMDAFEDWLYTHPNHTVAEREAFDRIFDRFNPSNDWSGVKRYKSIA